MRWYLSDRQRMAEVEGLVIENNVANHVLDARQGHRQGGRLRRFDGDVRLVEHG